MSDERVKAPYLNPKREKQQRDLIESIQAQGRGREVRIPMPAFKEPPAASLAEKGSKP